MNAGKPPKGKDGGASAQSPREPVPCGACGGTGHVPAGGALRGTLECLSCGGKGVLR
jgi:hypothetical protein